MRHPNGSLDDATLTELAGKIGNEFIRVYANNSDIPKVAIVAMAGALAACATAAGVSRDKVIVALNSVFDDIEGESK